MSGDLVVTKVERQRMDSRNLTLYIISTVGLAIKYRFENCKGAV